MPTIQDSPISELAQFDQLVSYHSQHADRGIPVELLSKLTAHRVYPLVAPLGLGGRAAQAYFQGWPGFYMAIAECLPQQGPLAHNHTGTLETFLCLDGCFDVSWGNNLENTIKLEPGDLCSVPPGVYRAFKNRTNSNARLVALIQGDGNMSDTVEYPESVQEWVRADYDDDMVQLLSSIRVNFGSNTAAEISMAAMNQRVAYASDLPSISSATGESIVSLMAPSKNRGSAPVEGWPGLDVALVDIEPGQESIAKTNADQLQYLVNLGREPCNVSIGERVHRAGQFDIVKIEPESRRLVKNLGDKRNRLLVVTQGRETA